MRIERGADIEAQRRELQRTERELDKAIQAIVDGVPGAKLKDKIGALEARKAELVPAATAGRSGVFEVRHTACLNNRSLVA